MNTTQKVEAFREIALERRSIRKYDETIDISHEEITEILELAVSAPSSSNMQPWRFVVVNRAQAKEKLLPFAQFNTKPISTASAVIAIYGDLESGQNAQNIMQKTAETRGETVDSIFPASPEGKSPREMVTPMLGSMTMEQKKSIAQIDCGLVAMQLMQAARVYGYDTCALGAYDRDGVAKALGMDDVRNVPIMLLTIGKAAEQGNPPYRLPVSAISTFCE